MYLLFPLLAGPLIAGAVGGKLTYIHDMTGQSQKNTGSIFNNTHRIDISLRKLTGMHNSKSIINRTHRIDISSRKLTDKHYMIGQA